MRYMSVLHTLAALAVAPVSIAAVVVGGPPSDSPGCTERTLNGGYGITALGTGAGLSMGVAETMVFDGQGRFHGKGTATFSRPAHAIRFEIRDGTYELGPDCTGTMHWYGNLPGYEPINHFHTADLVVMDGGRQLTFVYTSTTFDKAPAPGPFVQSTGWGHRM